MTQEALAEAACVNKATVVRFETNSDRADQATTTKLAKALRTTAHDMGAYVEALNLANDIVQLGPTGRDAVGKFLNERLQRAPKADRAR